MLALWRPQSMEFLKHCSMQNVSIYAPSVFNQFIQEVLILIQYLHILLTLKKGLIAPTVKFVAI